MLVRSVVKMLWLMKDTGLAILAGELTYVASSTLNNKNLSFYRNYYKSQFLKNKENNYNTNTTLSIIL